MGTLEDTLSTPVFRTLKRYHIMSTAGDIITTPGGFSTPEGYHDYT